MALGTTIGRSGNTVELRILGTYDDFISPEIAKAVGKSKQSLASLSQDGAAALGGMKTAAAAIVAAFSFREIKQTFKETLQYAKEHITSSSALVKNFDLAVDRLQRAAAESSIFKGALESLSVAAGILADILGGNRDRINESTKVALEKAKEINKELYNEQNKSNEIKKTRSDIAKEIAFQMQLIKDFERAERVLGTQVKSVQSELKSANSEAKAFTTVFGDAAGAMTAGMDFKKLKNNAANNINLLREEYKKLNEYVKKSDAENSQESLQSWIESRAAIVEAERAMVDSINEIRSKIIPLPESDMKNIQGTKEIPVRINSDFTRGAQQFKPYSTELLAISESQQGTMPSEAFLDSLQEKYGEVINTQSDFLAMQADIQDAMSYTNQITQAQSQLISDSLVVSFQALTDALIGVGGGFKAFAASILKVFGDFAIKIGTLMVSYGIGLNSIKTFSGPAAIAAGVALIGLGSALRSVSASIGGSGQGSRSTAVTTSRDYGTFAGAQNQTGGAVIQINNNFSEAIGLNEDSMKELGDKIAQSLSKGLKYNRYSFA